MDQTDATVRPDTLQAVERYALSVEDKWVVAVGKYAAVYLTSEREDAGTWASHDEAVEAAKIATNRLGKQAWVEVLVEPAYPRTWRLLEREVVVDQPEPAPLATDEELDRLVHNAADYDAALRAIYDLGRQHGARAAATEADKATAATVAEIRSLLFKDDAQPAPAAQLDPPSLKQEAWKLLEDYGTNGVRLTHEQCSTIRRALEALPDG